MARARIRISYLLLLCSMVLVLGAGPCETVQNATQDIKTSTENIKKGAEALESGMKGLDPAGINKILTENHDLRIQLERVVRQLDGGFQGRGVTQLNTRNVQVHVSQYTGSHRITGWVDLPENAFWKYRRFDNKNITLHFDPSADMNAAYHSAHDYATFWPRMVEAAQDKANEAFRQFLQTSALIPGPDERSIDLNAQFVSSGRHTVNFEVTPVQADESGKWSIRIEVILLKPEGTQERIKTIDLDNALYPSHKLGNALPLESLLLYISTDATTESR